MHPQPAQRRTPRAAHPRSPPRPPPLSADGQRCGRVHRQRRPRRLGHLQRGEHRGGAAGARLLCSHIHRHRRAGPGACVRACRRAGGALPACTQGPAACQWPVAVLHARTCSRRRLPTTTCAPPPLPCWPARPPGASPARRPAHPAAAAGPAQVLVVDCRLLSVDERKARNCVVPPESPGAPPAAIAVAAANATGQCAALRCAAWLGGAAGGGGPAGRVGWALAMAGADSMTPVQAAR
jgi:hypothetical protein